MDGSEHITSMPEVLQNEYVREHSGAHDAQNAHPIDEDILMSVCDTKVGPAMLHHDLALIQAVADRRLSSDGENVYHAGTTDGVSYYRVASVTFYDLLQMADRMYSGAYVEVEDLPDLVEAHTRQYLREVHGYEGDFGGETPGGPSGNEYEKTLCNAQNDSDVVRNEEPDGANYAFVDARGLVVTNDTHEVEPGNLHSIRTLVEALGVWEQIGGDSSDQQEAMDFLLRNYSTTVSRARTAYNRYELLSE